MPEGVADCIYARRSGGPDGLRRRRAPTRRTSERGPRGGRGRCSARPPSVAGSADSRRTTSAPIGYEGPDARPPPRAVP